jgi:Disulphide bond corrector protein DsbC
MRSRLIQSIALVFVICCTPKMAQSQVDLAEDKVKVTFTIEQDGCEATISAKVVMAKHWHINSAVLPDGSFGYATVFTIDKTSAFKTVGGVIEPKPISRYDEVAKEQLSYHEGTFTMKRKIKIESEKDFTISGSFDFQTCNEFKCLPPALYEFKLKVKGCSKEVVVVDENIESTFTKINGDEASDKSGKQFVKVDGKWHEVPAGNSVAFYKKYLTLIGKDEK